MTHDTTTTTGLSIGDNRENESNDVDVARSTTTPTTIAQKFIQGIERPTATDQQSSNLVVNEVVETSPMTVASLISIISSPEHTGSASPPSLDDAGMEKTYEHSNNENNNTICFTNENGVSAETSSCSSQNSTLLSDINYHPAKRDINKAEEDVAICYNPILDNEIRNRLDKLNALSDLINSLELKFDQANMLFRETLKCSTDRLSTIAKTLGSKSIRHGRIYQEAKISVEKTQTDCQRACVQFEQANNDHQFAKEAIREAEIRLKQMNANAPVRSNATRFRNSSFEFNDLGKLSLDDDDADDDNSEQGCSDPSDIPCDSKAESSKSPGAIETALQDGAVRCIGENDPATSSMNAQSSSKHNAQSKGACNHSSDDTKILDAARLSEDLNHAINKLIAAEEKRRQSEKLHLDQANKLMIAQENLLKLEREHGASIKRSQIYFDEARRFNIRLNSVKNDIARISEEIIAAKQAYAGTLHELERFSEDLHLNPNHLSSSDEQSSSSQQSSDESNQPDRLV